MRGTAAVLVCLISLHYLSVIDAHSARFTSENGMPGREHEDRHPRKSANVKRSVPESQDADVRQYVLYDGAPAYYGGLVHIPYEYRDAEDVPESKDDNMRQYALYDGAAAYYGGLIHIPYQYRDADVDAVDSVVDTNTNTTTNTNTSTSTSTSTSTNSISITLNRLLNSFVDSVRQLWGKLGIKPSSSIEAGPPAADTKRKIARSQASKKRAMDRRSGEDSETAEPDEGFVQGHLVYLADMAKKALDLAYGVVNGIDQSKLSEDTKELKQSVLEVIKKAKTDLGNLMDSVSIDMDPGWDRPRHVRRTRSVGKRTNRRDDLSGYLAGLRSPKRSHMRKSLRRSSKMNASKRDSVVYIMDLMTEMEDCIAKMPEKNASLIGVQCILLPLLRILASVKPDPGVLPVEVNSNFRSIKNEVRDSMRRLNLPWGNIFLIPIYEGISPSENVTTTTTTTQAPTDYPDQRANDQGFDNETTTTTEPPTTLTTKSTTEGRVTWPADYPMRSDSEKRARNDSKYRSKYDKDF